MTEHTKEILPGCDVVLAMVRRSGECPTEAFLGSLDRRFLARYQRYFERLRDNHSIKSPENLRFLRSGSNGTQVFELKADKYRLYVVKHMMTWYTTHGVAKVKDNRVPGEIDKALSIFWEWNGAKQ
ncbi:hypothetical protein [Arthrobacter sp. NPDC092385]|uniref:hypothetical protein n=1 Tax=Arthrobacter sp. NPDC092385 TaxID=3363943 RepID=UPI0038305F65